MIYGMLFMLKDFSTMSETESFHVQATQANVHTREFFFRAQAIRKDVFLI